MVHASAHLDRLSFWKEALYGYICTSLVVDKLGSLRVSVDKLKPEILLIDYDLCSNSPPCLRRYGAMYKVVILHNGICEKVEWELLKAGVRGCSRIDTEPNVLRQIVSVVQQGQYWFRRSLTSRLIDELGSTTSKNKAYRSAFGILNRLTQREFDIAMCIKNGDSNKQIATKCGISEQTVKCHLSEIYIKLGVSDRLNLALALSAADTDRVSPEIGGSILSVM